MVFRKLTFVNLTPSVQFSTPIIWCLCVYTGNKTSMATQSTTKVYHHIYITYKSSSPASPPLLAWIPITKSTHHNPLHIPQQKRVELYYFSKSFYCPTSSNFISISSCRICLLSLVLDTDIIRPISPVLYRKIKPEFMVIGSLI